jgi:hypothetical protein
VVSIDCLAGEGLMQFGRGLAGLEPTVSGSLQEYAPLFGRNRQTIKITLAAPRGSETAV